MTTVNEMQPVEPFRFALIELAVLLSLVQTRWRRDIANDVGVRGFVNFNRGKLFSG